MYCYLFEAKSIQSYLFCANKLKDVISASERLDRLVDNSENSVLAHVLNTAKLRSDLLQNVDGDDVIHFLRCKGGAFYAYCAKEASLLALRSAWTLTLSQLFPSLSYVDALSKGEKLQDAMTKGMSQLRADRNAPQITLPISTALMARYERTGKACVPMSLLAKKAGQDTEKGKGIADSGIVMTDLDTELHRQAYQALDMRVTKQNALLVSKFTPESLKDRIDYPIDFESQFEFSGDVSALSKAEKDAVKNMALIHIDGNGLGILLRKLKTKLEVLSDADYSQGFRLFSDALSAATEKAAQIATHQLYLRVCREKGISADERPALTLPMRPIVLGGDDVTLFCRADLALDFAKTFCKAFKRESEKALKPLFDEYLTETQDEKATKLKPYLTASGGILYHKAGHPFTHSHHLVEGLCKHAKALTKSVYGTDSNQVGPAALAFYRVSNASQNDIKALMTQTQQYPLAQGKTVNTGLNSYFVEPLTGSDESANAQVHNRSFDQLDAVIALSSKKEKLPPVSMAKWRQMATSLSQFDLTEAERIYHRALALCDDANAVTSLKMALTALAPKNALAEDQREWYWALTDSSSSYQSVINDLLIVNHFRSEHTQGDEE